MKILLLLSLISTMCSCLHKNADEGIWKNLPDKATIANTNKDKYKDSFLVDSLGKTIYPNYYTGSYVNTTYELVIGNNLFLITECEYSYNHLLSKSIVR